jgi:hypothetical protein
VFDMKRFVLLLSVLACATTQRQQLGDIRLRPYTQLAGSPDVFSVQQGRILNPNVDLVIEEDGCVRGMFRRQAVQLCERPGTLPPLEEGGKVQRWSGTGGDVTLEMQDNGNKMRMDGYVGQPGNSMTLQGTVLLGQGVQWDELRNHPILLAIAAGEAGVEGQPKEHTQPGE